VNYNGYDVEFLIEFDTNKPYYGIYYGARLCLQKDSLVELSNLEKDFKPIRKRITDVLELPLRTSDIVGKENGKIVFWPFSVTLGEEQDISVAENNLKKMKDVFEDIIAQKYAFSFKVVQ